MASRLDSTRVEDSPTQYWHPVVPAVPFVALVALLNGALNGFIAGMESTLPASLQFDYAVTVPLGVPGAGVLAVGAGLVAVSSLALFVRSVGNGSDSGLKPVPVTETLVRCGRATGVVVLGTLATTLGLALLVVPGVVVLVYLPFVFLAVVLDGQTVGSAVTASHTRVSARPGAVVATSLATVLALLGVGLLGVLSTLLPPAVEFVVGGVCSALVVLAGMSLLTRLYQRASPRPASNNGQL
jgi:hypothetical protein